MNDNKKKLNELINLLKWQIDMGADAMVEEKKIIFFKKENFLIKTKIKNFFSR